MFDVVEVIADQVETDLGDLGVADVFVTVVGVIAEGTGSGGRARQWRRRATSWRRNEAPTPTRRDAGEDGGFV